LQSKILAITAHYFVYPQIA